jgi:cell pole-organizing protein PopZ
MDQTDPSRDPLRSLAEAALARQEAAQRQRADDQAAVDRDQADQAEAADQAQTLAEAQQLAAEVFGAEGAELAAALTWTAVGSGQATATIDEHVLVYHRTPILWTEPVPPTAPEGPVTATRHRAGLTRHPVIELAGDSSQRRSCAGGGSHVRQLGRRPSAPLDMVDCLAATRSW